MKSIGNTTLTLGMLAAPVKIYSAESKLNDVNFKLCGPKGEDVEQVYRIVGSDTIVGNKNDCGRKWYDTQFDQSEIAMIGDESMVEDGVNLKESMQIQKFIPVKSIPTERVIGHYLLGPGKGSDKALATIKKAMAKKKVAAITKFCLRGRQSIFAVYVKDDILHAVKLSFAAQQNEIDHTVKTEAEPTKQEVDMAVTLLDAYTAEDASIIDEQEDTLVAKKMELIAAKEAGEKIKPTDKPKVKADPNVLGAIEASLASVKEEEKAAA